jgi:hypothetical protein
MNGCSDQQVSSELSLFMAVCIALVACIKLDAIAAHCAKTRIRMNSSKTV